MMQFLQRLLGSGATATSVAHSAVDRLRAEHLLDEGNDLENEGQFAEAEALYRKAAQIAPDLAQAWLNIGNALWAQQQTGEAAASYREALRRDPAYGAAHFNLGKLCFSQQRYADAAEHYTAALQALPDSMDALVGLGSAMQDLGRPTLTPAAPKTVLHIGCGAPDPQKLHRWFDHSVWREVRLDIDPNVQPDIVASMLDMNMVADASYDALYSSHNIEHLYPHEVRVALREFTRVLKPDGFALITCPDLQAVADLIADDKLEDTAYISPAGPIAPLDMVYGLRASLALGNLFMAHRTGFSQRTLGQHLVDGGFARVAVQRDIPAFALWAIAYQPQHPEAIKAPSAAAA